MIRAEKTKKLLVVVVLISLIPIEMVIYELITSDKDSIVVLEGYPTYVSIAILVYYVLFGLGILFFVVFKVVQQYKLLIEFKNEKNKTEIQLLQSQVNPHFFFNMLNNLYGLIDQDKERSKELVLQLSEMMRYSIYEGQKTEVSIQQEIDFIQNFIELHQMRYRKSVDVKFEYEVDNPDQQIMPLMYIVLVENAFKHGVELLRNNAFVRIKLKSTKQSIYFEIENNFEKEDLGRKGIGLTNLKRRLELVYPNQFDFNETISNSTYTTQLTLFP